jgi:PBP1b-binding outer membrane lipoprotein LpoB
MKMIHKWMLLLMAILALTVAGCTAATPTSSDRPAAPQSASPKQSGPRVAIDSPIIDFGSVAYDKRVEPIWTVSNVGDAPLQISDLKLTVEAGC